MELNVFHILADLSHAASILILLFAFYYNHSAEGVSLLTQILYLIVFLTRYIDIFLVPPSFSIWLFSFKISFLLTSTLTVVLMLRVFARTREREAAWKLAAWSTAGCLVTSPFVMLIFNDREDWSFVEFLWVFSIELESVCILPQLLLLRQTSVPTVLDSYYLVALGSYRLLYLINWIFTGAHGDHVDAESVIFGVIQTALYLDFAWIYYTRQRVKLRGGTVVDGDDLNKSFLVRRFIGTRSQNPQDDVVEDDELLAGQENGTIPQTSGTHWGPRGISVSADDTLAEHDLRGARQITDPAHFEDEDDDNEAPSPPAKDNHLKPAGQHEGEVSSSADHWSRD